MSLISCAVEIGAHFADRYVEGLITKEAKGSHNSLVKKLLKFVPLTIALTCFFATLVEYHFRAGLDGATRGICLIYYYYPHESAEIPWKLYGSSAQGTTILFAGFHLIGTIAHAVGKHGFGFAVVPLVLSVFQLAAKVVDCCRSHEVYVRCEVGGLRVINATHFRGSFLMNCITCAAGCPHMECGHCAPCEHCNRDQAA